MFKKLVKNKLKAFAKATEAISQLSLSYQEYIKNILGTKIDSKFIGLNAFDVTKFIFENDNYYDYVKYAQLAKKYESKITSIKSTIIILFILVGVILLLFIRPIWIPGILCVILIIILALILKKLPSGESYESFYQRTLVKFLCGLYPGLKISTGALTGISKSEIVSIIGSTYDEKRVISNIDYTGLNSKGHVTDIELYDITEVESKNGHTTEIRTKFFDGFYLKIISNTKGNLLKGNVIRIRADENILSHVAEDTFKSMYENEREISFNAEEMNKSFDARISGNKGFGTIDDALVAAKKIITPSFEKHLLYLRSRYNTFNMNISDIGIEMCVNMTRNLLQQVKHKELLDFKTTYREANEQFNMLHSDLVGISDFAYYRIFPFMERLYLINYLTYLYLSYTDFDNYYNLNNDAINKYEDDMKNIYMMNQKDFKEIYFEKIKKIKEETKKFALEFEKEER